MAGAGKIFECGIDYAGLLRCLREHHYPHTCAIEYCAAGSATWPLLKDELRQCHALVEAADISPSLSP
jgi:hypothetical protein